MSEPIKVTDRREGREVATLPPREVTPMDLLRIATSQGADLERLEKLMDLQQRWQADVAHRAFTEAMAAFHLEPPQLVKNKHVAFATKTGGMDYWHATHDEVTGKIGAALAKHGLSHSWRTRQADGMVYVTCTLTHALGHSESFELFGSPDASGLKSPLQAIASTITFLQRYTLLGATGLSTSELRDADDDGRAVQPTEPEPTDKNAEGMTFGEWCDNLDAVPDDQLAAFDFNACWRKAQPSWRRYVVKFKESWWNGKRDRAVQK